MGESKGCWLVAISFPGHRHSTRKPKPCTVFPMPSIKLVILDIDGVIIGEKKGYNYPDPHPDVIARLRSIRKKGIAVSLCTARPHFSIRNIINAAGLDNLHISQNGGLIIDPLDDVILRKHPLDREAAVAAVKLCLENGVYTELYGVDHYFVQEDQLPSPITDLHSHILGLKPTIVPSLVRLIQEEKEEPLRILPVLPDESGKKKFQKLFSTLGVDLSLHWGIHPVALPLQFGNITASGISKREAAQDIATHMGIHSDSILGAGDGMMDWQFIQDCAFAGIMGNAPDELKMIAATKGEGNFCIGKSVDENGLLTILDYFGV